MLAVANFHYIREDFSAPYPSIFGLTPDQFRSQLIELSKHGNFISPSDLIKENVSPDDHSILITFDDGLKEQFELAKPILEEMNIPFICFVNTSNFAEAEVSLVHKIHLLRSIISPEELENTVAKVSRIQLTGEEIIKAKEHYNYDSEYIARLKYLLNFRLDLNELKEILEPVFRKYFDETSVAKELYMEDHQLKEIFEKGFLGSHSHYHDPLGLISHDKIKVNLKLSQDFFKSKFGRPVELFSYPYGSFEACKELDSHLKDFGFKMAFTMERSINKDVNENRYLLGRYDCNDLPGGKNDLFKERKLFSNPKFAKWHLYENSSSNQ
jgi:peptidoglycan/xylan/chitin deacetylase (PgdA/CDA1 family)